MCPRIHLNDYIRVFALGGSTAPQGQEEGLSGQQAQGPGIRHTNQGGVYAACYGRRTCACGWRKHYASDIYRDDLRSGLVRMRIVLFCPLGLASSSGTFAAEQFVSLYSNVSVGSLQMRLHLPVCRTQWLIDRAIVLLIQLWDPGAWLSPRSSSCQAVMAACSSLSTVWAAIASPTSIAFSKSCGST